MIEWSDEMLMLQDAVRQFVDKEIRPNVDELEHGDLPPYDLLRKLYATFGMDGMAKAGFARRMAREAEGAPKEDDVTDISEVGSGGGAMAGFTLIPIVELCKVCPGMVTAMGVSIGLTAGTIMTRGTLGPKQRWAG